MGACTSSQPVHTINTTGSDVPVSKLGSKMDSIKTMTESEDIGQSCVTSSIDTEKQSLNVSRSEESLATLKREESNSESDDDDIPDEIPLPGAVPMNDYSNDTF